MINFRYHIVSLVAVFLALTIGIIMGTTVIDQALVKNLQQQRNSDARAKSDLRDENASLSRELELWDDFGAGLLPGLVAGRLRARTVIAIVEPGVEGSVTREIEETLTLAGATLGGRIVLSDKWMLKDDTSAEQLALAVGASDTRADVLLPAAAQRLASRLASPAPVGTGDVLDGLARGGFASLDDIGDAAFPAPGALAVIVSTGSDAAPSIADFTVPLLRALWPGMPTAVSEPLGTADALAAAVRGDRELRRVVSTIDHVDTIPGRYGLIVGLQQVALRRRAPHYGLGARTDAVAPSDIPAPQPSARASR